jgi:PEP-CTERM motif
MNKIFKSMLIAVLFSVVLPAQAAVQNYSFSGVLDSGDYVGESFAGAFSFDDATIDASGLDIANLLSFDISLLGTNYDLTHVLGTPDVSFQDGSLLGLSLNFDTTTPQIGFTFIPGSLDTSDAFVAYDTSSFGISGTGNVSYVLTAPIPEPETYAMLLAGLGLVGFMGAKRKII